MADNAGDWRPDPTGRHEHRFWDGTAWTDHVADSGQASVDPMKTGNADVAKANVDELRPDIAKAKSLMQTRLGSGREIKRLVGHLWDDEIVERMVSGRYGGGVGLLVLTDRRLIFLKDGVMRQTHEDFPLDKISSVQWSSGMALGKMQIFVSGNKAEIDNMNKKDGKDFTEFVRNRISSGGSAGASESAPPPAQPAAPPSLVADELAKLAQLRDSGVLSEDEFLAQKSRLLGS